MNQNRRLWNPPPERASASPLYGQMSFRIGREKRSRIGAS